MKTVITPEKHQELRRTYPLHQDTLQLKSDVIVIGSGAGGAVAAAELARAGWQVILFEEGSHFTAEDFTTNEFESFSHLYRDGGFINAELQSISIIQGRTVGGSTTVNWQTSLYIEPQVAEEWSSHFGLKGYDQAAMKPYLKTIYRKIGVAPVPKKLVNANNRLLRIGAKQSGVTTGDIPNNNRRLCIGLGRCSMGCPIDAKQSTALTFIPEAVQYGAMVFSNMRVESIRDGAVKKVTARLAPPPHRPLPANPITSIEAEAKYVVVAAGAIESPALLQRSGLGNEHVGRNLKLHPTASLLGIFPQEVKPYRGVPQSLYYREPESETDNGYGYWLEVAPYGPTLAALVLPYQADSQFEALSQLNQMQSGIVLARDGADGETENRVEYSGGVRKVYFNLNHRDGNSLLRGIQKMAQFQARAGATAIALPLTRFNKPYPVQPDDNLEWILKEDISEYKLALGSAHPHGSIQAASSSRRGALSPQFELYGHNNIFVMDSSWFPTALGINPMITTMSSALRATSELLTRNRT